MPWVVHIEPTGEVELKIRCWCVGFENPDCAAKQSRKRMLVRGANESWEQTWVGAAGEFARGSG